MTREYLENYAWLRFNLAQANYDQACDVRDEARQRGDWALFARAESQASDDLVEMLARQSELDALLGKRKERN